MRLSVVLFVPLALLGGCENTDLSLATGAAVDAVRAATLSDGEVLEIAARSARQADARHELAPADNPHALRLGRLFGRRVLQLKTPGSIPFKSSVSCAMRASSAGLSCRTGSTKGRQPKRVASV